MRVKRDMVIKFWILLTLCLTFICISAVFTLDIQGTVFDVSECKVEASLVGLPEINIVEVEKEIIVEKPITTYDFPFEVEEKGTYSLKAVCNDCMPKKEYSQLWGVEGITVFASENVMPEGTLIWIDGVGIRQVQTVYSEYDGIYVFFDSHKKAEEFSMMEAIVFEVLE